MKANRAIWFSLFFISVVFIYFFGGPVPYTLFYVMCILPLITLILNFAAVKGFKYTQSIDIKDAVKGQRIVFRYGIHNETPVIFPHVKIKFCNSDIIFAHNLETLNLTLKPFSSVTENVVLECRYRGQYAIGIEYFEFIDFSGIFSFRYRIKNPYVVTVRPLVINLGRFSINTSLASEVNSMLSSGYQDFSSVSSIRKYVYGDSRKSVHWKLTAKLGELMVRKYEFTSESEAVMIIDFCSPDLEKINSIAMEDKLVEAVVAVLNYCLSRYIKIEFVYFDGGIVKKILKEPTDFGEIYEFLSTVKFDQDLPVSDISDLLISEKISSVNFFIFTANLGAGVFNSIYKASIAGHTPSLVYISPEELTGSAPPDEAQILSELAARGISSYKINIKGSIKNILENSERGNQLFRKDA